MIFFVYVYPTINSFILFISVYIGWFYESESRECLIFSRKCFVKRDWQKCFKGMLEILNHLKASFCYHFDNISNIIVSVKIFSNIIWMIYDPIDLFFIFYLYKWVSDLNLKLK